MANITLFGQIIQRLDRSIFNKLVKVYDSDKHNKGFDSWSHLVSMLFCHFAKSQSLRDISNGLKSATGNLNHLGNVHPPSKSNLGYQNKNNNWELFQEYYYKLLEHLGQQAGFKQVKFRIKSKIFGFSLKCRLFFISLQKKQMDALKIKSYFSTLSSGEQEHLLSELTTLNVNSEYNLIELREIKFNEKQGVCPHCGNIKYTKMGKDKDVQRYKCKNWV